MNKLVEWQNPDNTTIHRHILIILSLTEALSPSCLDLFHLNHDSKPSLIT